jgi:hypothetical protein
MGVIGETTVPFTGGNGGINMDGRIVRIDSRLSGENSGIDGPGGTSAAIHLVVGFRKPFV